MKKSVGSFLLLYILCPLIEVTVYQVKPASSLPPPEDIPEEILRTEIILEARSPVDGKPLSAAEYAQLRTQLQTAPSKPPQVSPQVQHLIFLLQLSYPLRKLFPFLRF